MNDELTTALRDRAARGSDPGPTALWDAAVATAAPRRRHRRNRTRLLIVSTVSGLLVAAVLVVAVRNENSADVAIETQGQPTTTHRQPSEVSDPTDTVHLALPNGWVQTPSPVATTPPAVLTIGTSADGPPEYCNVTEPPAPSAPSGTWLILYEYLGYENGSPLLVPTGGGVGMMPSINGVGALDAANLHDRPVDFLSDDFFFNAERYCGLASRSVDKVFRDNGRAFLVRIVTTEPLAKREYTKGLRILNSLRVDPLTSPPVATGPATSCPPDTCAEYFPAYSPNTGPGLSIDAPLPTGWNSVPGPLFRDVGNTYPIPRAELTVATFEVPAEIDARCDYPMAAIERMGQRDAFVSVADSYGSNVNGRPITDAFLPSPLPTDEQPEGERDLSTGYCLETRGPDFRFNVTGFTENGRQVSVFVGIGLEAGPAIEGQIKEIIDQLVVAPRS